MPPELHFIDAPLKTEKVQALPHCLPSTAQLSTMLHHSPPLQLKLPCCSDVSRSLLVKRPLTPEMRGEVGSLPRGAGPSPRPPVDLDALSVSRFYSPFLRVRFRGL